MEKYWPYATEQQQPLSDLLDRFVQWKFAISTITDYLVSVQNMDKLHVKELARLTHRLDGIETQMGSHSIFKHWSIIGSSTTSAIQTADQQFINLVLGRLESLKSLVKKKQKYFADDIDSNSKRVLKTRSKTAHAIDAHEKMQMSRQSNNTLPWSPHSTDPWLHERILQQLLIEMVEEENKYQKQMSNLFHEMGVFDAHVVEELKRILEEYGMLRGSLLTSCQATLNNAIGIAVSVDATTYFEHLNKTLCLDSAPIWKHERTIQDFAFHAQDIKVLKTGLMYRKNMFGCMYPVQAVLTATGFFHCFELDRKHPLIEYYTKKNVNQHEPVPFMEEKAASPRISIQALKPGKPVLTIVVHNRRPNLFTSEIKNHEFKCLSEGDMIEWMASLQQTIQYFLLTRTLIPNGPPEPLFKSPQAIEENVQSLINDSNSLLVKNYPRKSLANEQHSTETLQDNEESIPTQSLSRKATSPEQEISSDYLNKTAEIREPMLQEAQ